MGSSIVAAVILCCFVFVSQAIPRDVENEEWIQWKNTHAKVYAVHEESHRRMVWEDNRRFVLRHNYEFDLGKHTFTVGLNKFADMTNEEFRAMYLTAKRPSSSDPPSYCQTDSNIKELLGMPNTVDWRKHGYVTPVKDQKQCGSCWAFSATGSLEGQTFKKTGKLVSLSEQNLVDCSFPEGNLGCEGGFGSEAYRYINKNGGVDTEASYPYLAVNGKCMYNASNVGAMVTGCTQIESMSESKLKTAVASVGPIAVSIDAGHPSFQLYEEGVYYEPDCSQTILDHGVLAVGYGTDSDGKDYWLVKNSWGTSWGNLGGYIKMSRNRNNNCGISTDAIFPLV